LETLGRGSDALDITHQLAGLGNAPQFVAAQDAADEQPDNHQDDRHFHQRPAAGENLRNRVDFSGQDSIVKTVFPDPTLNAHAPPFSCRLSCLLSRLPAPKRAGRSGTRYITLAEFAQFAESFLFRNLCPFSRGTSRLAGKHPASSK